MPGETKHGMECSEFDALLLEALDDGGLSGIRKEAFEAHRRVCPVCGPMFTEVEAGKQWLRTLALERVEPPLHLVHNILAATSGVPSSRPLNVTAGGKTPVGERMRQWWDSFFSPTAAFVRQPRFVMSFGMIFFTFSLALNFAGVKASDMAKVDLRPTAVRHAYYDAQIKVVKYYDNIRFVYEIESKVRELKKANAPDESNTPQQKENRKNDTSGQPEQKQDRNYSREENETVLAGLTERLDEVVPCRQAARCELPGSSTLLAGTANQIDGGPVAKKVFAVMSEATNRRLV